jgi:hypothetical protein
LWHDPEALDRADKASTIATAPSNDMIQCGHHIAVNDDSVVRSFARLSSAFLRWVNGTTSPSAKSVTGSPARGQFATLVLLAGGSDRQGRLLCAGGTGQSASLYWIVSGQSGNALPGLPKGKECKLPDWSNAVPGVNETAHWRL